MWCWGTSSRSVLVGAVLLLAAVPAAARVFVTVDEALKLAFPGCGIARRTAFLKPEQVQRARDLAGAEVPSALVNYYVATRGGQPAGTAYFDTHRVRTLPETLMIVVDPQGKVGRIEVISFREPEEYLPRGVWYEQFRGRALNPDLQLKRDIRPVTGATLTARATTDAVRRVLALHQVLGEGKR
jgi:FMN-binding domain